MASKLNLYTDNVQEYLECDEITDFDDTSVQELAERLYRNSEDETDFIRKAYEYVRDNNLIRQI